MFQLISIIEWISSKFQSYVTKIYYINVRVQNIQKVDESLVNQDENLC